MAEHWSSHDIRVRYPSCRSSPLNLGSESELCCRIGFAKVVVANRLSRAVFKIGTRLLFVIPWTSFLGIDSVFRERKREREREKRERERERERKGASWSVHYWPPALLFRSNLVRGRSLFVDGTMSI